MVLEMNTLIASHKTLGIPSLAAAPISWFCTPVTNWKSTKSEHSQKFLDLTVIFPELFQCTVLLYLNIISSLNILTSCDDALVYKTLLDGIELSAHFLTPTSEHKIYETTSVDFCYDAPSGTILMSQFCPATGRLCLLSESNFIYILDFLSSPTRNIGMLLHSSLSPLLAHILTFFLFGRHHMYALMIAQTCFISCEPIFMVHWTLITCLYDEMDHLFRTLLPNELEIVVTSAHPIHYHFNRETKSNLNGFTNDNNSPACELVIESSDKTRSPDTSYPALFLTFSTMWKASGHRMPTRSVEIDLKALNGESYRADSIQIADTL